MASSPADDRGDSMKRLDEEKGYILVLALMFLLVLCILGLNAINTTSYDNRISGNKRTRTWIWPE